MPILNISDKNIANQEFRWTSLRTFYAIFSCGSLAFYAILTLCYNFTKKMTIESFGKLLFNINLLLRNFYSLPSSLFRILHLKHDRDCVLSVPGPKVAQVDRQVDGNRTPIGPETESKWQMEEADLARLATLDKDSISDRIHPVPVRYRT